MRQFENPQNKHRKLRVVIIIALIGILVIASGVGYIRYQQNQQAQRAHELAQADQKLQEQAKKLIESEPTLQKDNIGKKIYRYGCFDRDAYRVIINYKKYPFNYLKHLAKSYEWMPTVLNYPNRKKRVKSQYKMQTLDHIDYNAKQFDPRWAYEPYGDLDIAVSGCGPMVLSLTASYLNQDPNMTPVKVARIAEEEGYYVPNVGTSWDLFSNKAVKNFGLKECGLTSKEFSAVKQHLDKGEIIICTMLPGDFTQVGHYIIIDGYLNDKVHVVDPNSRYRTKYWTYHDIEDQINNLWSYTKAK